MDWFKKADLILISDTDHCGTRGVLVDQFDHKSRNENRWRDQCRGAYLRGRGVIQMKIDWLITLRHLGNFCASDYMGFRPNLVGDWQVLKEICDRV